MDVRDLTLKKLESRKVRPSGYMDCCIYNEACYTLKIGKNSYTWPVLRSKSW